MDGIEEQEEEERRYGEAGRDRSRRRLDSVLESPVRLVGSCRTPVTLLESDPVREAVRLMARREVGAVLVVSTDGRLRGIFTERDLLARVVDPGLEPGATRLGDVMTPNPLRLRPRDRIGYAFVGMGRRFRHLPLVDDGDRPYGMVSTRDLLDFVVDCLRDQLGNLPPAPAGAPAEVEGG
ncbi:MAG: CBS domain-containing protein [Planctomycetales bacterium]|nr:CBS domain-containing protein [Planctomycetales bacterium]